MALVNTPSRKQLMKANGFRVKSQGKEKSFSRVEAFSKDLSRTISSKGMEKCTTTLQEIILRGSGKMTRKKAKEQ